MFACFVFPYISHAAAALEAFRRHLAMFASGEEAFCFCKLKYESFHFYSFFLSLKLIDLYFYSKSIHSFILYFLYFIFFHFIEYLMCIVNNLYKKEYKNKQERGPIRVRYC